MAMETLPNFDKAWDYNDPAGTETKFRKILSDTEKTAPTAYTAELLTQIARCQGLQDKFAAANHTLDRVETMLRPELHRAEVRYLLERGRVFNSSGDPKKALPLFNRAWELGKSAGEANLALDALHMIAIVQPTAAGKVEWNLKGIEEIEKTHAERGWLPAFYNNLGEAYAEEADYEKALKAFQNLAAIDSRHGRSPDMYTQKDIAKMLRKLGRTHEAMEIIKPIYDQLDQKKQPDGWIDEEMAECLLAENKSAEARPLFRRAYDALRTDPWVLKNDPAKLVRLKAQSN